MYDSDDFNRLSNVDLAELFKNRRRREKLLASQQCKTVIFTSDKEVAAMKIAEYEIGLIQQGKLLPR